MDDKTLWLQITDARPDQQYGDLGTPWRIGLEFGEEMKIENSAGGYAVSYPFRIGLESLAARGMMEYEYEQGNTGEHFLQENLRNLRFSQTKCLGYGFEPINTERFDYLDVEHKDDTYTLVITLPEWFAVSVYDDLTYVDISLYPTKHYADLYQNGSTAGFEHYCFYLSIIPENIEPVPPEEAVKDVLAETSPVQENKPAHNDPVPPVNSEDFMPDEEPVVSIPPLEPDFTPTDAPVIDNGEPPVVYPFSG